MCLPSVFYSMKQVLLYWAVVNLVSCSTRLQVRIRQCAPLILLEAPDCSGSLFGRRCVKLCLIPSCTRLDDCNPSGMLQGLAQSSRLQWQQSYVGTSKQCMTRMVLTLVWHRSMSVCEDSTQQIATHISMLTSHNIPMIAVCHS